MSSYISYNCNICDKSFKQKIHHTNHIKSSKHQDKTKIFKLELEKLSKTEMRNKYGISNIEKIVKKNSKVKKEFLSEDEDIDTEKSDISIKISSKESMKDMIHDIHNYLRNNGAGYGMNALKLFTLFYGLAKIEKNGHFDKTGLDKSCKFSTILSKLKKEPEIGYEYLQEEILNKIYENENINQILCCEIPVNMKSETIYELVKKINELVDNEEKLGFQLAGKIYEYFIGRDQTAISELGAYFTDRHITEYIYNNVLEPQINSNNTVKSMCDMFGGSGGFTTGYIMYLLDKYPDIDWSTQLKNVFHYDMNLDVVKYAKLEFYCLTGELPKENVNTINSFTHNYSNKYDYICTNPPYGGDKITKSEQTETIELIKTHCEEYFKEKYKIRSMKELSKIKKLDSKELNKIKQYDKVSKKLKLIDEENRAKTVSLAGSSKMFQVYATENNIDIKKCKDKESVSFLMMMNLLEKNGTAVGVLKEGLFFDKKYQHLRKLCVENFNIEKIVSIDASQFENTTTKTSIIKFSNTGKTKNIKFYELIVDKDDKTELTENDDGTFKLAKVKDRITNIYDKLVAEASYDDLVKNDFTFNYKKYNIKKLIPGDGYEMVKLGDIVSSINGYAFKTSEYVDKGIPVITITNINNKKLLNNNRYILENKKYNKYLIKKDDILLSLTGKKPNVITTYIVSQEIKMYLNQRCAIIRNIKKINNIYLNSIFESILKEQINKYLNNGTNQDNLSLENNILNLQIPIPKSEKKIKYWVNKINKPYNTIQESKNKLKILEEQVQENIQKMLDENDTEDVMLGDLCDFKNGKKWNTKDGKKFGKYPLFSSSLNIDYYLDSYDYNIESIIINTINGSGNFNIHYSKKFNVTTNTLVLTNKYIRFIYYFCNKNIDLICKLASGSTKKKLGKKDISVFKITLPKDRKLIDTLNPLFNEIDELKEIVPQQEKLYQQYLDELKAEAIKQNDDIVSTSKDTKKSKNSKSKKLTL